MADEGVEGQIEQRVLYTPDRHRDLSASTLTRPKADCPHTGVENGARPKGAGLSVTLYRINTHPSVYSSAGNRDPNPSFSPYPQPPPPYPSTSLHLPFQFSASLPPCHSHDGRPSLTMTVADARSQLIVPAGREHTGIRAFPFFAAAQKATGSQTVFVASFALDRF